MTDNREDDWIEARTAAGRVALDPALGNIRRLSFTVGGRSLAPLHTAPWVSEDLGPDCDDLIPVERSLSGDFFCAPFGASDVEPAPAHGWTANSAWEELDAPDGAMRLKLKRSVMGAGVVKELRLSAEAPLLYQTHEVSGGRGALTVAHHPMVRVGGHGWFSTSPKRAVLTPATPLEPGRNALATGVRTDDLKAVPATDGGLIDLTEVPIATAHEDFVTLVEAEGRRIGWSAIVREVEDDVVFFLKDARVLPVTMLWHSNGGRDYAPWNGRNRGVIGVEDGCAAGAAGHAASLGPNAVSREGAATALPLGEGTVHRIAHVIGAIPRPRGWCRIADIVLAEGALTLVGEDGQVVALPFAQGFFGGDE